MAEMELSNQEIERYTRHINLQDIGIEGQIQIKKSAVLVVGVGGLGSVSTSLLTRAGVGRLGIIDHDKISLSDLQRQILYSTQDIGSQKVRIAQKRLNEINPNVNIQAYQESFNETNARHLIEEYDFVIDGTDNLKTRYLINRMCIELEKPYIFGAVDQYTGQVSVFWQGHGPCLACLLPPTQSPPLPKKKPPINVLSPLVLIVGSIQVTEAIKLITGSGHPLLGELLIINTLDMRFDKVSIPQQEDCPICGGINNQ